MKKLMLIVLLVFTLNSIFAKSKAGFSMKSGVVNSKYTMEIKDSEAAGVFIELTLAGVQPIESRREGDNVLYWYSIEEATTIGLLSESQYNKLKREGFKYFVLVRRTLQ